MPGARVTGDSVYGADSALRRFIVEGSGRGYVLAVTSGQRLGRKPVERAGSRTCRPRRGSG